MKHNHRYTSISILCQTESEVVGRALGPSSPGIVYCYIIIIRALIFSCVNVMGGL